MTPPPPSSRSGSVVFDRAAAYYDETRALTPEAMERVLAILARELRGRGRCLDLGTGTGRFSLPLHERGIPVAGVDLSAAMLGRLVAKAGGVPFPLVRGDATALPFTGGAFGATFAAHVLHLIPPWRDALGEMVRVTRPGGTVLIDRGGFAQGWTHRVEVRFCREAGVESRFPGVNEDGEIEDAMRALGLQARPLETVEETRHVTVEELVRRLEDGLFSFTWAIEESKRGPAAEVTREWARRTLGPLDEPRRVDRTIRWRAFDVP